MKKFKGTKGNWKTYNHKNCIDIIRDDSSNNAGPLIAQVYNTIDQDEYVRVNGIIEDKPKLEQTELFANAKLIAAAPELLTALQDLLKYCEKNHTYDELEFAYNAVKKAI